MEQLSFNYVLRETGVSAGGKETEPGLTRIY